MKLLKEPLLHFLLLGALIFLLYSWRQGPMFSGDEIRITTLMQQNMSEVFRRTWRRPPTDAELDGLVRDRTREELAYREALAMGLEQDDIIIRRRLRQKLEMLAEDVATLNPPTDMQLQEWFEFHAGDYQVPATYTIKQVFVSFGESTEETRLRSLGLLEELQTDESSIDIVKAGDPIMLPSIVRSVTASEVAATFGTEFTDAVVAAPVGKWGGPVVSGFGLHLLKVETYTAARRADFSEVRQRLERDWLAEQKLKALDAMYAGFAENYRVVIEPKAQP